MRVCLTVQGEQPSISATSRILRGSPSGKAGRELAPTSPRIAPVRVESAQVGAGHACGPEWPEGGKAEGLRARDPRAVGAEPMPPRMRESLTPAPVASWPCMPGLSANPSANGTPNPRATLAGDLAEALRPKARKISVSASRRCAASVSADACLSLVFAITIRTCF
jgi:hypothetical protein